MRNRSMAVASIRCIAATETAEAEWREMEEERAGEFKCVEEET